MLDATSLSPFALRMPADGDLDSLEATEFRGHQLVGTAERFARLEGKAIQHDRERAFTHDLAPDERGGIDDDWELAVEPRRVARSCCHFESPGDLVILDIERVHRIGREFEFEGRLERQAGDGREPIAAIQLEIANPL